MNIRQFCESYKKEHNENEPEELYFNPDWNLILNKAGYYHAVLRSPEHWQHVHEWCVKYYTKDHYIWTGNTFWFETESDAVWFSLRWS
jgi:hypothetical protein